MKFEAAHKLFRTVIGSGLAFYVIYVVSAGVPFHWAMIVIPGFLVGVNTETATAILHALERLRGRLK